MYEIGCGTADITSFVPDIGMMGYGMHFNTVKGIATPLLARAFVFRDPETGRTAGLVVAELCFISAAVKTGVLRKLHRDHPEIPFQESNLLLSAQHTHSGPGGYSHYGFYNLSIPGFVPRVWSGIVEGIVEALVKAYQNLQPGRILPGQARFGPEREVAFNRSLNAYNRNPDVKPLRKGEEHLAVDRDLWLWRLETQQGQPLGQVNWFGVHTTSISNDNHDIHHDNKGQASQLFEAEMQRRYPGQAFSAAFAQASAGDVTPNFVWDKKKKWTRGKYEDDRESATWHGQQQCEVALEAFDAAATTAPLTGPISWAMLYANMARVEAHPDFTGGKKGCWTSPGCLGVTFFEGTTEGPGLPPAVGFFARRLSTLIFAYEKATQVFRRKARRKVVRDKYIAQGRKHIIVETGSRRVLGSSDVKNLIFPGFVDKSYATFKHHHRIGALHKKPWTPQVLPLQLLRIGQVCLAAIPAEITVVAGRRLRTMLEQELKPIGIQQVILCPYSNAYSGYITTYEEYQVQRYEGSHTVFGEWTLAAYMTRFRELAQRMIRLSAAEPLEDAPMTEFTEEEIARRSYKSGTA